MLLEDGKPQRGIKTYWRDVNKTETEPNEARDERDEGFVPMTLLVTDDPDHWADQSGGRSESQSDEHQEEQDGEYL